MSRIGHAKTLARVIIAELDRMDQTHADEIKRVCNLAMPLAIAIEAGYVSQVTEEGLAELVHLADILLTDEWKAYRVLAGQVQVDDVVEMTTFEGERIQVRVTKRPENIAWSFHAVRVRPYGADPVSQERIFLDLFWGGRAKPVLIATR